MSRLTIISREAMNHLPEIALAMRCALQTDSAPDIAPAFRAMIDAINQCLPSGEEITRDEINAWICPDLVALTNRNTH